MAFRGIFDRIYRIDRMEKESARLGAGASHAQSRAQLSLGEFGIHHLLLRQTLNEY